jgi:hypothetical protein
MMSEPAFREDLSLEAAEEAEERDLDAILLFLS